MKSRRHWGLIITTALLSLAAWASVTTDYDHSANFAKYKTYSWGTLQAGNSIWEQRVKNAIESQLAAKGWTRVSSSGDVVVNAIGVTSVQQNTEISWSGFGRGFGGPFGTATASPETYRVGTLVVDMFDASSK